jgi:hypothetical protein
VAPPTHAAVALVARRRTDSTRLDGAAFTPGAVLLTLADLGRAKVPRLRGRDGGRGVVATLAMADEAVARRVTAGRCCRSSQAGTPGGQIQTLAFAQ